MRLLALPFAIAAVLFFGALWAWEVMVKFKWWLVDVYLTIRYGKWVVMRERIDAYGSQPAGFEYFAICRRSKDMILCDSKREAEGVCASRNDMRGQ